MRCQKNRIRTGLVRLLILATINIQQSHPYKIALVPKWTNNPEAFYGLAFEGCQVRATEYGDLECLFTGSENVDVNETIRILDELINDPNIDGIAVAPLDPEAYAPVINRGVARGKAIICFDSDAPETDRLVFVGTDNFAMGKELSKLLKQIKPDGGKYGIISGYGDNLKERVSGVRDAMKDSLWTEIPGSLKNGQEDPGIALQKMWELVEGNPDIGAIVSVNGVPMFSNEKDWENFVENNKNLLTIIADTSPVQLELMQKSLVDALVGQLPYNMGYLSADALLEILKKRDSGIPIREIQYSETIHVTHQLEVMRIPLVLPELVFDKIQLGNLAVLGYVLSALIMGGSIGLMLWTWYNQSNIVVKSSQPLFLIMICLGALLMGSAIIPLSIDDGKGQKAADITCMFFPWLTNIGFTISFAALFSKTWRLNKILLNPNPYRRITVRPMDVILPFVGLLTINIITLTCWTIIAPLKYVRRMKEGTDLWNRPIASYGQCQSTSDTRGGSMPYLVVLGVVNITALCVANLQAYHARKAKTEFNESTHIGMASASLLQATLICIPIVFLTTKGENPEATFFVLISYIFIISGAVLVCIFVPKILAIRQRRKKKKNSCQVTITGLDLESSLARIRWQRLSRISSETKCDPVKHLLNTFQSLSLTQKSEVMKKLGSVTVPVEWSTDCEIAMKPDTIIIPGRTEDSLLRVYSNDV